MPRERGEKVIATNRRARHDYTIEKSYEAGMVLTGTEVKSLRQGRANLSDGYAFVKGNEVFLDAVHIPEYSQGTWTNHAPRRKRKLLLHGHEIEDLQQRTREKGFTIVPLRLYFLDGRAKLEIGLGRGKKMHDKRQALREKQDKRESERSLGVQRRLNT